MMPDYVLFEDAGFANLLPMLYWRTMFELRCGRSTLASRLQHFLGAAPKGLWTRAWIAPVAAERFALPVNQPVTPGIVLVNGRWLSQSPISFPAAPAIGMCDGEIAFVVCDDRLAGCLGPKNFLDLDDRAALEDVTSVVEVPGAMVRYPWDVVLKSAELLKSDWLSSDALVAGDVHSSAVLLCPESIRIESGARVMPSAVIDASEGPVYIESGATIRPFAYIAGPVFIGAGTIVNPQAYIHGGSSIGPTCKVGGEVDACVFQGFSNKQHEGFLGHSYLGSWVNVGAGTVNSDLKNTYGSVRMPIHGQPVDTRQLFVGAIIGDHAKTAINTAIPTGAVIGFGVNITYSRLLPQFVGSFSWVTDQSLVEADHKKLVETAKLAMQRRSVRMTEAEASLFAKLPQIVEYFEPALSAQRQAFGFPSPDQAIRRTAQALPEGPSIR